MTTGGEKIFEVNYSGCSGCGPCMTTNDLDNVLLFGCWINSQQINDMSEPDKVAALQSVLQTTVVVSITNTNTNLATGWRN